MSAATADNGQEKKQKSLVRKTVDDESGFTLVEIIAVLVILGILAAVAVPKYFDLQTKAKEKAMAGAMAEAAGRLTQRFGDEILNGTAQDAITYNATDLGTNMGDFILAVTSGAAADSNDPITLQVTGRAGTGLSGEIVSKTFPRPGSP